MPQLQPLVLTDRAATPVNHTFVPLNIKDGVGTVVETSGVPIGNNRVTVSTVQNSGGRYKSSIRGTFPIVQDQTINGVSSPVVVRTAYVDVTFTFDQSSTEAERNNVVGMIQDALAADQPLINDAVVKLQGVY